MKNFETDISDFVNLMVDELEGFKAKMDCSYL